MTLKQLPRIKLIRKYCGEDGTLGKFFNERGILLSYALERPKTYNGKENIPDNSKTSINESCCVPEGVYAVKRTYSRHFEKLMFILQNVNGRDGIRIHAANTIDQLLGCIAPCMTIEENVKFEGKVYRYFASDSKKALEKLESMLPDDFVLEITSEDSLCSVDHSILA